MTYDYNLTSKFTNVNFKANPAKIANNAGKNISENLSGNLNGKQKFLAKIINVKEGDSGLSHSRFVQATATNWVPKAVFARSIADLSEITFLEVFEGAIFFYLPSLMGEFFSRRKVFSKFLPKELHNEVSKPVSEIIKHTETAKKLLPNKAAIVLSCTAIPAAGYALSFAKNLFTLKVFNKSDFSSIVNLDKNKKEDIKANERVEKSAKSSIKKAGFVSLATFAGSLALAAIGPKSKSLQKASEIFLNPGAKIYKRMESSGIKSKNLKKFLETYVNLDFDRKSNGSFGLGKGQLAFTVCSAVAGYFAAAKDRGKLDVMEVATRLPLIALYTIFGSELLDSGFKNYLFKNGKFKEILTQDKNTKELKVASLNEIYDIAKKSVNGDEKLLKSKVSELFKGKAAISLTPFIFSLLGVGALVSLISRIWTKYRFNKGIGNANFQHQNVIFTGQYVSPKIKNFSEFTGNKKL